MRGLTVVVILSVVGCGKSEPEPKVRTSVDVPRVAGHGFAALSEDTGPVVITATPTGLVIDGRTIVAIKDGAVDAAEIEGGALGINLPRVKMFLQHWRETSKQPTNTAILILHKDTPFRVLVMIAYTAKQVGVNRFELVAKAGETLVAAPIDLPDKGAGPDRPPQDPNDVPLRMFVSITKDKIIPWSISQLEGTLKNPTKIFDTSSKTAVSDLGAALADIVKRRWLGRSRREEDLAIVIQADAMIPAQLIAEIMGAARATPDGKELFPVVHLSSGFE